MKEPMKVARVNIEGSLYSDGEFQLLFGRYEYDGSLAVMLQTLEGEPQATLSVYLDDPHTNEVSFWGKNYSENEGILDSLEGSNVVVRTGRIVYSGFAPFPEFMLCEPYRTVAHEYMEDDS